MKKIIVICVLILSLCASIVGCSQNKSSDSKSSSYDSGSGAQKFTTAPEYTVQNQQDNSLGGQKRFIYKILVPKDTTDEQLKIIFNGLDRSEYNDVTVFFYKDKAAYDSNSYFAVMERTDKSNPVIKRK